MLNKSNLFAEVPAGSREEFVEILGQGPGNFTIERIVSAGHSSPLDFWYDQETVEWVFLLAGSATLMFRNPEEVVEMTPGDWIKIPAHRQHRVEETSGESDTIWLGIHSEAETAPDTQSDQ